MIKKNHTILLLCPLFLMLVVVVLSAEMPRTLIDVWGYGVSVDVIVAFFLGWIPFIYLQIRNRHHLPSKLFNTQYGNNRYVYKENSGKAITYEFHKSGGGRGFFFFVKSKRLVSGIEKIGIRPQANISWWRSRLKDNNSKTRNIDSNERDNPPIRIVDVKDVSNSGQPPISVADDGACGKWLHYAPTINMKPDSDMVFWVEIQANKSWDGYIDFRLNTDDGRRVAHHSCRLRRR